MDGIMNENLLPIVKEYEFKNPLIQKVVLKNIFIKSNIDLFTILNLQTPLIMKQLISQFLIKSWVCMT